MAPYDPANATERFDMILLNDKLEDVGVLAVDGWSATKMIVAH